MTSLAWKTPDFFRSDVLFYEMPEYVQAICAEGYLLEAMFYYYIYPR
jgi:hypothetical protein